MISHLATGGMAQIYLARQTGLGSFERHVVLKTILRERASDQRFVTMFLDEAKLAATLNHQNVAQVYEVDQADGAYFMAMEYVHGENARAILETTLRRGWTIPLELAVMIISGAAAGLHHAHERRGKNGQPLNIVHRDVSPANIMVGYDGSVKVLDFGIAKAEERATKTVGGTIKGKYGYMSPEQCKGKPIDRRSDIFALGIVLYELTTLRRAFKGNDDFETMKRIVAGDVVLPSVAVPGLSARARGDRADRDGERSERAVPDRAGADRGARRVRGAREAHRLEHGDGPVHGPAVRHQEGAVGRRRASDRSHADQRPSVAEHDDATTRRRWSSSDRERARPRATRRSRARPPPWQPTRRDRRRAPHARRSPTRPQRAGRSSATPPRPAPRAAARRATTPLEHRHAPPMPR